MSEATDARAPPPAPKTVEQVNAEIDRLSTDLRVALRLGGLDLLLMSVYERGTNRIYVVGHQELRQRFLASLPAEARSNEELAHGEAPPKRPAPGGSPTGAEIFQ